MKLGELKHWCGECKVAEYCADPCETPCICIQDVLKKIEQEEYKEIAENLKDDEINAKIEQMCKSGATDYDREYQGAILELVIEKLRSIGKIGEEW